MTVLVDDPLIAGMAITRTLPLHESSRRLRDLYPECPRIYGVVVMADLFRRRWWPLAEALTTDRLRTMFDVAATETATRAAATQQLAATLAHVVIGRVVPLVVSAATQVPLLAGSSELTQHATRPGGSRRAGRVRVAGARRDSGGRREELAKLGQPCLFF